MTADAFLLKAGNLLDAPDCTIFVDADISETELVGLVAEWLFADDSPVIGCEANVLRNADYDSNRRQQFPDGFVYFRYLIDLYMDETIHKTTGPDKAEVVTRLLEGLWDWGYPAVAACNYEDQLPHHGGYRSRAVPWPE